MLGCDNVEYEFNQTTLFPLSRISTLSWAPRAFSFRGFLSDEECDHLIYLAKDKLRRSNIARGNRRRTRISKTRSSAGMFIPFNHDEVVARIEDRIALWTMIPKDHGESMQILRYNLGERYEDHYDSMPRTGTQEEGLFRVATVMMYLSDVESGGETVFPFGTKSESKNHETYSECGRRGLSVRPRKGDALLFFSGTPGGELDLYSMHAGCPVTKGTKWAATKWIHPRSWVQPPVGSEVS